MARAYCPLTSGSTPHRYQHLCPYTARMGYRDWDETAALDRLSDWLERHRAVRVAVVMLVALLVLGVDFSAPMVALRSAVLSGAFVTSLVIVLVQFARRRRRRHASTGPDEAA